MKKTKMGELYDLYLLRPEISNREAATILGVSNGTLRQMKSRLSLSGNIKVAANGSVSMIEPPRGSDASLAADPALARRNYKAEVYYEMVDSYLEDFRQQATFADRLAVGREIRLILEQL